MSTVDLLSYSAREERQILEEERTADNHECRANRHGCYPEQLHMQIKLQGISMRLDMLLLRRMK